MEKMSFKIAWRSLFKNKSFTLINLGGLAIGLAASLLLLIYVANEWKFNSQYNNPESIFEVKANQLNDAQEIVSTGDLTPNALAPTLKNEFSAIQDIAKITGADQVLIVNENAGIKVQNRFADADILKILSYKFIDGSAETAFRQPNSIILTRHTAERLFPNTTAFNKQVKFMNFAKLTVTGVIEDLPENMSYRFESLVSLNENQRIFPKSLQWDNFSFYTLLRLRPEIKIDDFNVSLKGFMHKHHDKINAEIFGYPLLKSYLYGDFVNGKPVGGKIQQVRIFIGLALGILMIACINFMNLSTARAGKRSKEVGIKKTIGASRNSLICQFLLEAVLMVLFSAILAVIFVELSLPFFNNLLQTKLSLATLGLFNWLCVALAVLCTAILSGSYPAFFLSSFDPISTLKGISRSNSSSVSLRKVLVVVQFSFAVLLITGTIVIYKQLQFLKNRPVGYDSSALVEMPLEGMLFQKYEAFKSRLLQSGAISAMCKTTGSISSQNSVTNGLEWDGMSAGDKSIGFNQIITTNDFSRTTGVKMLMGRDFDKETASDSVGILLNKSAIKAMNLKDPIGKKVLYLGVRRTIIGVFQDIIWANPSKKEMPMVIGWLSSVPSVITMKLNPSIDTKKALTLISRISKEMNPVYPVELKFVDALYQEKFEQERILSVLSNLFGALAIFISCLGLLGLSAYSAALRTKEIGIRKVLGASHFNILILLSWDFVKMVLFAVIISLPVSYIMMDNWLSQFDFHVEINVFMMLFSAAMIIGVAYFTVSFQAIRAASADPVTAIKYE
jgi:ABC-type antimicrobial peptide transport system permease subunit